MALKKGWFKELKQALMIPEIIAERCVHSHCEVAACVNCVEACPLDAWLLDDDSLQINTERCDGCGLCVAACTESALGQTLLPALKALDGKGTLLIACEKVWEEDAGEGVIPCLHAVSSRLLLEYYLNGYQQILSCRGHCETCPRYGGGDPFREQLARLNALLASRGAVTIRHAQLAPPEWEGIRKSSSTHRLQRGAEDVMASRRQFFRQTMRFAVEKGMEQAGIDLQENTAPPWPATLPASNTLDTSKVLYPFVPEVDASRCNGCDSCIQLCPHQALQLAKTGSGEVTAYQIRAEYCTGCNICSDVCDQQAIHIQTMGRQRRKTLPLMETGCQACGNLFHSPVSGDVLPPYCRICSHTNHQRKLFQVY